MGRERKSGVEREKEGNWGEVNPIKAHTYMYRNASVKPIIIYCCMLVTPQNGKLVI